MAKGQTVKSAAQVLIVYLMSFLYAIKIFKLNKFVKGGQFVLV
jgi:hypothetical protein